VVDNGSDAGEIERLRPALPPNAEVTVSSINLGYAGGNNLGIAHLREHYDPDYYWILNNDTTVDPGAAAALVDYAEAHPRVGAVGATILYPDGRTVYCLGGGTVNRWTAFDRLMGAGRNRERPAAAPHLDYISGASIVLTRNAVAATNGFDPDYFLYSEEADLCFRLKRAGLGLGYAPDAVVFHRAASSTVYHSPTYVYYFLRGKLRYQLRWARPWHWVTSAPCIVGIYALGFLWRAARGGRPLPLRPILQAFADAARGRWGRRTNPPG
jgi:GT2 family glycosyltransferase